MKICKFVSSSRRLQSLKSLPNYGFKNNDSYENLNNRLNFSAIVNIYNMNANVITKREKKNTHSVSLNLPSINIIESRTPLSIKKIIRLKPEKNCKKYACSIITKKKSAP